MELRDSRSRLVPLLRPASVAVIGASDREGTFGNRLWNAVSGGCRTRAVYPVNPRLDRLSGVGCYASLAELPQVPDLVCFAVSDERVETAFREAADLGVPAAAIFGRAHEEAVPGVPVLVERLAALAREANMAVCGNNCMGFVNVVDDLVVCASPPPLPAPAGPVGLVSHGGSIWSALLGNQRQLRYNYAISAGQEIATSVADYIDFLVDQPETRVIGCVLETVREPEAFLRALDRADARGIAVVALKLGRTERGRQMALAHTGALAGSESAYAAALDRRNVVRVHTLDEMVDTLELFASPRRPASPALGIVTDSGAEREVLVDLAEEYDIPLAQLAPQTLAELDAVLDPGMAGDNPVDCYGDGRALIRECLSIFAKDPNVGIVALANNMVHGRPAILQRVEAALDETVAATDKPVVCFGQLQTAMSRETAAAIRSKDIPVLMGSATSLLALKHFGEWQARRAARAAEREPADEAKVPFDPATITSAANGAVPPEQAFGILQAWGIPVARSVFAHDEDGVRRAAAKVGFPLVLKTASPDILHKTELKGIVVGLNDIDATLDAYRDIAGRCGPQIQVQAQAESGIELLVGMTNNPPFGPMVTIGLGGIFTEILADAVTLQPPLGHAQIHSALQRLKGRKLLDGYRGSRGADIAALCETVRRFSLLCAAIGEHFSEIEINPLIATPAGNVAVDALMIVKK